MNWVLLIAGQFNDKMLFDGVGNADEVLVEVDVGLVEAADVDDVVVTALLTGTSAVLLGLVVSLSLSLLALLSLLPLLVLFLPAKAPTTPPTTAATMTSKITDPMMSAFRFGTPHQRLG